MCRWVVYYGKKVLLADIVTRPVNSIMHQSQHDPYLPGISGDKEEIAKRNHRINGDGFGVAWYDYREPAPEEGEEDEANGVEVLAPCVFTSIRPSWNDKNLSRIALHIRSHCIFSHVRAASPGSMIVENNCHPFKFGRLLFMHNGGIAHFPYIKYDILAAIGRTSAHYITGTTDTEYAGALLVHYLPNHDPTAAFTGRVMKKAMLCMMAHLLKLVERYEAQTDEPHLPSSCNFAVTDGVVVIATRFRDTRPGDKSEPPSLYYSECIKIETAPNEMLYQFRNSSNTLVKKSTGLLMRHKKRQEHDEKQKGEEKDEEQDDKKQKEEVESVIVASEPLYKSEEAWNLVPDNHLIVVTPKNDIILEPIELDQVSEQDLDVVYAPTVVQPPLHAGGVKERGDDTEDVKEKSELEVGKSLVKRTRAKHMVKPSLSNMVREQMPKTPSPVLHRVPVASVGCGISRSADDKGTASKPPVDTKRLSVPQERRHDDTQLPKDFPPAQPTASISKPSATPTPPAESPAVVELRISRGFLLSIVVNVVLALLLFFVFRGTVCMSLLA